MTETLWAGDFGDAYTERNLDIGNDRESFWRGLIEEYPIETVLEVGCNAGANLVHLPGAVGVDVNEKALACVPFGIRRKQASATALPFADHSFDLTFTMGVLIHIPPEDLYRAMSEIVRCSRRYVLCGEYHAETEEEVPYRGRGWALWRRPYGEAYREGFGLTLVDSGFLSGGSWDDITWWLFERA